MYAVNFVNLPKATGPLAAPRPGRTCDICKGIIHPGEHAVAFTKPGFTATNPVTGVAHLDCVEQEESECP